MVILLSYIEPFHTVINPNVSRNGFVFGDEKGPWGIEQITNVLTKLTERQLSIRITTRMYRQISTAIDRKFMRGVDLELDGEEDNVHDLMATHSTAMATARYGRLSGLIQELTPESIDIFRGISDRWQSWYGLVSRLPRDMVLPKVVQVSSVSTRMKIDRALCHLFGPSGSLRGRQKEGLLAVLEGLSPLFVILPTGAGKSLLFLIPALFDGAKSTVVIIPLVALAENLLDECKKCRIDASMWGRGQPRRAKIIIMITEAVVSADCRGFIQDCLMDGELERIVFDECHMIVTEESYRPLLGELWRLNLQVQMVFMSATYPPSFAPIFQEKMVTKEPFTIREANHKPNCSYSVVEYTVRSELVDIIKAGCELCVGERKVNPAIVSFLHFRFLSFANRNDYVRSWRGLWVAGFIILIMRRRVRC